MGRCEVKTKGAKHMLKTSTFLSIYLHCIEDTKEPNVHFFSVLLQCFLLLYFSFGLLIITVKLLQRLNSLGVNSDSNINSSMCCWFRFDFSLFH